jgi:hypothetical protein
MAYRALLAYQVEMVNRVNQVIRRDCQVLYQDHEVIPVCLVVQVCL